MASRPPSWQRQLLTTLTRLEEGFAGLRGDVQVIRSDMQGLREEMHGLREDMRTGFSTISHFVDRNERESSSRIDDLEARVARLEQSRTT